jgi:hypothetical protein
MKTLPLKDAVTPQQAAIITKLHQALGWTTPSQLFDGKILPAPLIDLVKLGVVERKQNPKAPHVHLSYGAKAHKERCQRNGSNPDTVGVGSAIQGLFRLRDGVTPDTLMNRSSVTPAQAHQLRCISNVVKAMRSGWCSTRLYDKKLARFFEKGEIQVTKENIKDWLCDVPEQTMDYAWRIDHNRSLMKHLTEGTPLRVFRIRPGVDIEAVIETAGLQFHQGDNAPAPDEVGPSIAEKNDIDAINKVKDEWLRSISDIRHDISEDAKKFLIMCVQDIVSKALKPRRPCKNTATAF